jgi:hypothetical protein
MTAVFGLKMHQKVVPPWASCYQLVKDLFILCYGRVIFLGNPMRDELRQKLSSHSQPMTM